MVENTKIEWATHTFNPFVGCTKVSPGCDHCYAESWAKRTGQSGLWKGDRRRTSAANWRQPLKWSAAARDTDPRPRVFCASLADVFDNEVPDEWREDLFKLILQTQRLDWLLLTKRIGNVERMLPPAWEDGFPSNVWLGITVVNQEEADRDIPKLLRVPAAVRFLSCEPLLGPIEFGGLATFGLHWVICGGESGHKARTMELDWAIRLRHACGARGIRFFMKQGSQTQNWDDYKDFETFYPAIRVREFPPHPTGDGAPHNLK